MPQHIALDVNFTPGTAIFSNQKQLKVTFNQPFDIAPTIQLTMNDASVSIPYKISVNKTDFTIKLQTPYTGSIDWTAIGRK